MNYGNKMNGTRPLPCFYNRLKGQQSGVWQKYIITVLPAKDYHTQLSLFLSRENRWDWIHPVAAEYL